MQTGAQLCHLFVTIIRDCTSADPRALHCGTSFGLLSMMTLGICFRLMPIFQNHLMHKFRTIAFI
jgi:hypothetical protein